MSRLLPVDSRGSSAVEEVGNYEGDGAKSEGDGEFSSGDYPRPGLRREVQKIVPDQRCLHHLGDNPASAAVSWSYSRS